MYRLFDVIDSIQKDIFSFQIIDAISEVDKFILELSKIMPILDQKDTIVLNEALQLFNIGVQNKDYLLLADILEYEIKPVLNKYSTLEN